MKSAKSGTFSNFPFHPGKIPFFYGWVIIFLGTLGTFMSLPGQTIGVSTFTDYLLEALALNRDQLSTAYMVGTISSSFLLTFAGKMYDRYGGRLVATAAALGMGMMLVYMSHADKLAKTLIAWFPAVPAYVMTFAVVFPGFFFLRFFGQGSLTMASRNMIMEWFEARRGFANALSGPFISLGFSGSPLLFDMLIQQMGWRQAWIFLAVVFGFVFSVVALTFYRDKPEKSGLKPDGNYSAVGKKVKKHGKPAKYAFTLKEARGNWSFWVFALTLSVFTMYVTGFTFHVVSIFESSGLTREQAISVFLPASIIAVALNMTGSWLTDYIKLKYFLMLMTLGGLLSTYGFSHLSEGLNYWLLITGNGILSGMFGILLTITWPKYFGRQHLGAISGFNQALNVFFSAIGPWLLSLSLSHMGTYAFAGKVMMGIWVVLFLTALRAENPQDKFTEAPSSPTA